MMVMNVHSLPSMCCRNTLPDWIFELAEAGWFSAFSSCSRWPGNARWTPTVYTALVLPDPPIPIWRVNSPHDGPLTSVSACQARKSRDGFGAAGPPVMVVFCPRCCITAIVPVVALLMAKDDEVVWHWCRAIWLHERFPERRGLTWRRLGEMHVIHVRSSCRRGLRLGRYRYRSGEDHRDGERWRC